MPPTSWPHEHQEPKAALGPDPFLSLSLHHSPWCCLVSLTVEAALECSCGMFPWPAPISREARTVRAESTHTELQDPVDTQERPWLRGLLTTMGSSSVQES